MWALILQGLSKTRHDSGKRVVRAIVPTLLVVLLSLGFGASSQAQRWYGNFSFSAQKTRTAPSLAPNRGLYMAQATVNVEDVLFYKNRLRLAGNFDWRDDMYTSFHVYRPIFYGDLYGYGYALNTTYSPYKRMSARFGDSTGAATTNVFNRDWRATFSFNLPKYPTLNVVHNRYRQYDDQPVPVYNSRQRTWVVEAGWQKEAYSLRANYNLAKRENYEDRGKDDRVRSVVGTVSGLTPASKIGTLGATYNYYDTKRTVPGTFGDKSNTHSVTLMASSAFVRKFNVAGSYSGRFTESTDRFQNSIGSRAETMSGAVTYSPAGYLELQAAKAYQMDNREQVYDISEYITLSASLTRYLRRGVDTRLAMTRTIYQQSNRVIEFVDSVGALDSSRRINEYTIDSWYGSIRCSPVPYVKTNAAYSISRDSDPISADRTYQSTGTADARLSITRRIEARLAYTSSYKGERLRLGHAFSESWNVSGTWIPQGNMNLAVAYNRAIVNTITKNISDNLAVYLSYAFRRAFSFYLSYGRQQQSQTAGTFASSAQPQNWNAHLTIYTGKRSTLTMGYIKSLSNIELGSVRRISEMYQAVFNFRI